MAAAPAAAQSGEMTINVFGTGAFGGTFDGETSYSGDGLGNRFEDDDYAADEDDAADVDMGWTNGIGAQFDYSINEYFSVGARLAINFVDFEDLSENDGTRAMFVNVNGVVKGRYPISGAPVELYAAVPIGVSLNAPGSRYEEAGKIALLEDVETRGDASLNVSAHVGFQYWFSDGFGIFLEQGLYRQNVAFGGNGDFPVIGQQVDFTTTGVFNQWEVNLGVSIGL